MSPKSIQQRLDSLKEQTLILSINSRLDEILKSQEEPHVCQGSDCPNNDINSCHGHTGCKGDGLCGCNHAKEFDHAGHELKTKSLGSAPSNVGRIVTDSGEVIEGFFIIPGGGFCE